MPVIADPSGKLHDIPDDVFAERMAEVCKGYEMSDEQAGQYLQREQDLLQKLQSDSSQDDEEVKAYMNGCWDPSGALINKPLPLPGRPSPSPGGLSPWTPRPRPWWGLQITEM